MPLNLEQKKALVAKVAQVAQKAVAVVAANYRGLTVAQMNQLRVRARAAGVYVKVVPNTLAKKALEDTDLFCISKELTGPMVLAFSLSEPGAAAKLFKEFCKENESVEVKAIALGKQLLAGSALEQVASLPSKDEAIAMLMAVMQAPVAKAARTFTEVYAKLVRVVAAVKDKKQAA